MSDEISLRHLRNQVSSVLRDVEDGVTYVVTVDRRPVAELRPLPRRSHGAPMSVAEEVARRYPADRRLLGELRAAFPDTTDEL